MPLSPKAAAAAATILWGFTYILTTTMLPHNPWFIAAVRALGGGLPLLLFARALPPAGWWGKMIVLGTLNNGLFFGLLFVAAIRLPGGVAATFQALGPLFMVLLALPLLGVRPAGGKLIAVAAGVVGVAMVVLQGGAALDLIGVLAALGAALSVALGGTLYSKWKPPVSVVTMAAWQMIIAGIELAIIAAILGDIPPAITATNVLGLAILALAITALPFVLWFTGIKGVGPAAVAPMLLLTPITAFVLDALVRGIVPSAVQTLGIAIVIGSLLYGQYVDRNTAKG
ncbi:DMT family transporter [Ketogulonicigenium vulgare]|uniref:Putative transporter, permease protein n=1 Tax=Ketogulonicigenium vulgare (strain WSH-001) TaxID=759362 RepID=F9Y418_KETVW|nr:DMT family transporter [Ketogulonicigenium vulgare]ADO43427.1 PecM protein [Ketogulonicigenium vulgare Y25]AEM41709.1 putative transporter, permease protein [Ketogulonicigenium vulgare WSH-001]ALJ81819.1 permease [Ketogulonicigenium vulgare]ANW34472.1 permease [Ketogulonicigenium vulgare]AOZ55462.1 PecM protein [Ketogulonicigenium vulgare]